MTAPQPTHILATCKPRAFYSKQTDAMNTIYWKRGQSDRKQMRDNEMWRAEVEGRGGKERVESGSNLCVCVCVCCLGEGRGPVCSRSVVIPSWGSFLGQGY